MVDDPEHHANTRPEYVTPLIRAHNEQHLNKAVFVSILLPVPPFYLIQGLLHHQMPDVLLNHILQLLILFHASADQTSINSGESFLLDEMKRNCEHPILHLLLWHPIDYLHGPLHKIPIFLHAHYHIYQYYQNVFYSNGL